MKKDILKKRKQLKKKRFKKKKKTPKDQIERAGDQAACIIYCI